MTRGFLPIALSVLLAAGSMPLAFAASDSQLNFKIYSPDGASTAPAKSDEAPAAAAPAESAPAAAETAPAAAEPATADAAPADKSNDSTTVTESKPELTKEEPAMSAPATSTTSDTDTAPAAAATTGGTETPTADTSTTTTADTTSGDKSESTAAAEAKGDKQVLQGYVREVPAQTKIPIIMDTAVDSDTSQEGDEFAARTAEDLTIDGTIVVPAGSIIKGRIAQLNSPKHFIRSGSVALKFDTVTTPDNRSIPLVANLVAHGGVVHAKRGLKDYAIDSGTVAAPLLIGTVIGLVAGKSNNNNNNSNNNNNNNSKSMGKGTAMALGAGVGLVVGVAILCAKKGKKVDVRPGDELKIELAEALRMPMM